MCVYLLPLTENMNPSANVEKNAVGSRAGVMNRCPPVSTRQYVCVGTDGSSPAVTQRGGGKECPTCRSQVRDGERSSYYEHQRLQSSLDVTEVSQGRTSCSTTCCVTSHKLL
jgi:hypothetical protein